MALQVDAARVRRAARLRRQRLDRRLQPRHIAGRHGHGAGDPASEQPRGIRARRPVAVQQLVAEAHDRAVEPAGALEDVYLAAPDHRHRSRHDVRDLAVDQVVARTRARPDQLVVVVPVRAPRAALALGSERSVLELHDLERRPGVAEAIDVDVALPGHPLTVSLRAAPLGVVTRARAHVRVHAMVVIAGVDGSERSRDAIVLGQRIAAVLEAQLVAVHVYPVDELPGYLEEGSLPEVRRLLEEAAGLAHARVQELAAEMKVDDARLRTASSPAAGLHAAAVEEDTQLIVVGSSAQSGLDRLSPGSTANRLLSGSPVAVAIAPVGYAGQQDEGDAVACGYDGSPGAREALRWAAEFARRGRRPLRVLAVQRQLAFGHVGVTGAFGAKSANDELRAELARDLEQTIAELAIESVESEILEGDPVQQLAESSAGVALLVLGSRGYGPVRTVLLGSVSAGVVRTAACPVLVVPSGVAPLTHDAAST